MVVQHNLTAMNANRYLGINNSKLSKSLEKLSSGYAINRAGDNAAGLAVSEKMRSQIAGMTQGVKNAQDGISMVQTFEGALTETDSILQRMKTLADQAANGTYQDDVDRDAIQLEFDQLNDELNQIADTDFNGVVVLNGGQMADGTVAVNGKFDYTLGKTATVIAAEATDLSATDNQAHTIVDQSNYDKAKADAVWNALGVDVNDVQDLNVTFMYDGERWMAQTVTTKDKNGKDVLVDGANAAKLEAREVERDGATGRGGFEVIAGKDPYSGEDIVATNAIFDEMKGLKRGDTITINFQNSKQKTYAPKNAGLDECFDATNKVAFKTSDATKIAVEDMTGKISFKLDDGITDAAMTKDISNALKALDAADLQVAYDAGAAGAVTVDVANVTAAKGFSADVVAAAAKLTVDADNNIVYDGKIKLGQVTAKNITEDVPATAAKAASLGTGTYTGTVTFDATKVDEAKVAKDASVTLTYDDGSTGGTAGWKCGADVGMNVAALEKYGITAMPTGATMGQTIVVNGASDAKPATSGNKATATADITFGVNIDAFNFADMSKLTVHSVDTPKIATMAHQVAKDGVSVSNAHGNGAAPLTYTDNITLQTGARSKDAVNFTFKYTSGGMGNLKSNMNCSAREDGLNTASLSLKTAESANYAIDQIDNAINKVSMVRATFGAVQNRLEHKIDNMNVSIENLTSAESQIRDTNMPQEMMNFTKQQILAQASQSMLAQANQLPQSVLSLLQ